MSVSMEGLRSGDAIRVSESSSKLRNTVGLLDARETHAQPSFDLTRHPVLGVPIDFINGTGVMDTIERWRRESPCILSTT